MARSQRQTEGNSSESTLEELRSIRIRQMRPVTLPVTRCLHIFRKQPIQKASESQPRGKGHQKVSEQPVKQQRGLTLPSVSLPQVTVGKVLSLVTRLMRVR